MTSPQIQTEAQVQFPDSTSFTQPTGLLIAGKFVPAADNTSFPTDNPFTQSTICNIARGKAADVDKAVEAARQALPGWKSITPSEKGKLLLKLAELIERDLEILAKIEVCFIHSKVGNIKWFR